MKKKISIKAEEDSKYFTNFRAYSKIQNLNFITYENFNIISI